MFADLHLHTHFSDGTFSPEEVAKRAKDVGLSAISLTDHDTVDGCMKMHSACKEIGVEFIAGCEFTVEQDGRELHMLAYNFDIENKDLLSVLRKYQEIRRNRIHKIVNRLNEYGILLSIDRVMKMADCVAPGRPHIARALVVGGHCRNIDEAFQKYLKKGKPGWVEKDKISALDAINLIHNAGGVAVMAHPGINRMDDIIPDLVVAGMDGLECFYTRHSTAVTEHYLILAEQHDLLVTGGSDCHGENKGRPLIGGVKVPYEYVEKIKTATAIVG